jgi:hypothetical protein
MRVFVNHRKLRKQIDAYAAKLGSPTAVNSDDVARCHVLKLVLEKESEMRLRSIQTLAELRHSTGVGPAINDLVSACRKWPKDSRLAWLLMVSLKDYFDGYPGYEAK